MTHVLIPTDFSDNAWDALTYAIRLYDDIPCTFYILHTYESNPARMPNTLHQFAARKISEILRKESEDKLFAILQHLKDNMLNDKHTYKTISKLGALIPTIANIVEKERIDLIVMGSKGATGLKEVFMGTNTVKVIKHVENCPIICVPEEYPYKELEQLIFATDYKKRFDKQALSSLMELQQIHNFRIRFVHVKKESMLSELQESNRRDLEKYFNKDAINFEEIESDALVSKAITTFAEMKKANLICLANYEHSFIEKLTHEPVIQKVGFHTKIPLLILPI